MFSNSYAKLRDGKYVIVNDIYQDTENRFRMQVKLIKEEKIDVIIAMDLDMIECQCTGLISEKGLTMVEALKCHSILFL